MAKVSQKIDLSPVVNEINDNEIDISTEHQLTRSSLAATESALNTQLTDTKNAVEGKVSTEAGATRTKVQNEAQSTRSTVNSARDNVKSHVTNKKVFTKLWKGEVSASAGAISDYYIDFVLPDHFDVNKTEIIVVNVMRSDSTNGAMAAFTNADFLSSNKLRAYFSGTNSAVTYTIKVMLKQWDF